MSKEYFFISGLPRSGSTLLSAILKQNPEFHADISSPLFDLSQEVIKKLFISESTFNISEDIRKEIIKGIFNSYFKDVKATTVFDTNRAWTSKTDLLKILFPQTKIICCTRNIAWILDSFERIVTKNSLYDNFLFDEEEKLSVYSRCKSLMDVQKSGKIIKPILWLEEGLAKNSDMIHVVEYDIFCKNPKETMQNVYKFLNKPYFDHNFDNVEYDNDEYDIPLGLKGLHKVRKKVEWVERKTILPEKIFNQYNNQKNNSLGVYT